MISWLHHRTNGSALIVILFHFTLNVLGAVTHQLFTGPDWTRDYIFYIAVAFMLTAMLIVNTGLQSNIGPMFAPMGGLREQDDRT